MVERFWAQVDRSGGQDACWPWMGAVHANGYGVFNVGTRQELVHRVALVASGQEIPVGLVVMRTCDNRLCCNTAHLWVATPAERMAARSRLRRVPRRKDPETPEDG